MFTEFDNYLFHEGTMYEGYRKMGAHICEKNGQMGTIFTVWAENARSVSVAIFDHIGEYKDISADVDFVPVTNVTVPMKKVQPGIWEIFVAHVTKATCYKYIVEGADGIVRWKSDPYAFYSELRPASASVVWGLNDYPWTDDEYMKNARPELLPVSANESTSGWKRFIEAASQSAAKGRAAETTSPQARAFDNKVTEDVLSPEDAVLDKKKTDAESEADKKNDPAAPVKYAVNWENVSKNRMKPMSIYEVHLGSWKKDYRLNEDGFLNYRQLADELSEYVDYMGFTHVEVMGICEYPFDGSWGYQVTGYFSATSRHGDPEDFKYFVDKMHSKNIGVIIDWVPAHYPKDVFGLENFDGTAMYESSDPLLAEYPEWGTKAFDHGKAEVRSFLISSAFYWIKEFHADALRVDAVASMIYTNFSRNPWRPNKYGGNQNLESIAFLKQLNNEVVERTGAFLIAEDSSTEQGITTSVDEGGMGFLYKWNMGWMNDTLKYFKYDPVYRKYHFGEITHTPDYVFTEYFVNVLSHDEVVHLKKPMIWKMPGGKPEQLSGLKTLYTYQFTHPGKKLLFMGQEFAEDREWDEKREINWALASDVWHRDVMMCVRNLLQIYKKYPALYEDTSDTRVFEWVNRSDYQRGIMAYIRRNPFSYDDALLVIINTTPVQYSGYSCGAPVAGYYKRIFSTYDSTPGSGKVSSELPPLVSAEDLCDGYNNKITYDLRPNEAAIFEFPVVNKK